MEIAIGLFWILTFAAFIGIASHAVWWGVERSLDDEDESDRNRTRECRQMLAEMKKTTKDTK